MLKKEEISLLLDAAQFGLTTEEIARKTKINEPTAVKMLENLTAEKKVRKTKAGRATFYRSAKLAALAFIFD